MTALITALPGYGEALRALVALRDDHGSEARQRAQEYGHVYSGQRGAMVVDVVASRQRRYEVRVRDGIVRDYVANVPDLGLRALATAPPTWLPLRRGEAETMAEVASGLLRWGETQGLDADEGAVQSWAEASEAVRFSPSLDAYVGSIKGIGPALFAYLRMRAGADALKPDLRVHRALRDRGLALPSDPVPLLTAAEVLAFELDISRLVLDQLLWWA